jgi:hypothetical protein
MKDFHNNQKPIIVSILATIIFKVNIELTTSLVTSYDNSTLQSLNINISLKIEDLTNFLVILMIETNLSCKFHNLAFRHF